MPVWELSGANVLIDAATTIVLSDAVLLPFNAAGSPPPETVAKLVTDGTAVEATETTRVIGLPLAPAAIAALLVQVTVGAANAHAQPVPVADTKPSPAGSESVTVMTPLVARE